jgi:hypothetical protein
VGEAANIDPRKAMEIEAALWEVAQERGREHGYPFGGGSEDHLRQFIAGGAQAMAREALGTESPEMDKAKENVRVFVDEMAVEVAQEGLPEFHEPTFFAASARLCPGLFPFC